MNTPFRQILMTPVGITGLHTSRSHIPDVYPLAEIENEAQPFFTTSFQNFTQLNGKILMEKPSMFSVSMHFRNHG
jgi:hypothetical protein